MGAIRGKLMTKNTLKSASGYRIRAMKVVMALTLVLIAFAPTAASADLQFGSSSHVPPPKNGK
jgi:hypothetical protein